MPCYHPLKGFKCGLNANGKQNIKVVPYSVDHVELIGDSLVPYNDSFVSAACDKVYRDYIDLPCGHCIGCRIKYSRDWANRLMLEAKYHDENYFVTLTYDNNHLPITYYGDEFTGEANEISTLRVDDTQRFFKRLRKYKPNDHIRYFLAGEYGPKTNRPHYHAIIFGLHLDDLKQAGANEMKQPYFTSDLISRAWTERYSDTPNGFVSVAPANWETCAYVARYVTSKLTGVESEYYDHFNIKPPFVTMSRKPGIAYQYFEDHKDEMFECDQIDVALPDRGLSFRPFRYYMNKYELEEPELIAELKDSHQKAAAAARDLKIQLSNKSYLELLEDEERVFHQRTSKLIRNKI